MSKLLPRKDCTRNRGVAQQVKAACVPYPRVRLSLSASAPNLVSYLTQVIDFFVTHVGKMVGVFGCSLQPGKAVVIATIWRVNQGMEDLSINPSQSSLCLSSKNAHFFL